LGGCAPGSSRAEPVCAHETARVPSVRDAASQQQAASEADHESRELCEHRYATTMPRFAIDHTYEAECQVGEEFPTGEIYHVARNKHGGANITPIARSLMVWRGIERSPGFGFLAAALGRHVSSEAAGIILAPFALSDAEELRGLIAAAGFRDIAIRPVPGTVRFPSVARFVQDYVAGSPLAAHVAKGSDEAHVVSAKK
jgi:hypothetical protein